jgi:hypothetical protein
MPSERILPLEAALSDGAIVTRLPAAALAAAVMEQKRIAVLKKVFPADRLAALRTAVHAWGHTVAPAAADDFTANYHRKRVMISRLQQAPHLFHDYNFHAFGALPDELAALLHGLFEPLRQLYNTLTARDLEFTVPASGPYLHPQIIHYPNGGGFFGRHWHALEPQQLGFIVVLSAQGEHYPRGATVFDIDGEVVDLEGRQQLGDVCIWRYDHPHWVTQSDLGHKFDWDAPDGRWVATFAYFDPKG